MSDKQEVVMMTPDEFRQRQISESLQQAAELQLDVSRPGGAFLVGGVLVDANGIEIKDASPDNIDAKIEEMRQLLAEIQANQPVAVTGYPQNQIPGGDSQEPFLSQMQTPVNREEVIEAQGQSVEAEAEFESEVESDVEPVENVFDPSRSMRDLTDEARGMGVDLTGVRSKSDLIARMEEKVAFDQAEAESQPTNEVSE